MRTRTHNISTTVEIFPNLSQKSLTNFLPCEIIYVDMLTPTLKKRGEAIRLYLEGVPKREIGQALGIPTRQVTSLIHNADIDKFKLTKTNYELEIARENRRIAEIKDKALTLIEDAIDEANDAENDKLGKAVAVNNLLNTVDRIQRLNNDKPTDINESKNTNINIDMHKVLQELKTPEEKKQFLLKQLQNKNVKQK